MKTNRFNGFCLLLLSVCASGGAASCGGEARPAQHSDTRGDRSDSGEADGGSRCADADADCGNGAASCGDRLGWHPLPVSPIAVGRDGDGLCIIGEGNLAPMGGLLMPLLDEAAGEPRALKRYKLAGGELTVVGALTLPDRATPSGGAGLTQFRGYQVPEYCSAGDPIVDHCGKGEVVVASVEDGVAHLTRVRSGGAIVEPLARSPISRRPAFLGEFGPSRIKHLRDRNPPFSGSPTFLRGRHDCRRRRGTALHPRGGLRHHVCDFDPLQRPAGPEPAPLRRRAGRLGRG